MKILQIGDRVGDYAVIAIAGSGGSATVYKIEHVLTRRIEAMKLLPAGATGDAEQVRRFERAIQLQARLHHPNIAALYNAVRDGESMALVMEFVEGQSLQSRIAAGPLPLETALDFAIQVLRALAYAHAAGIVHRDVSPANIIITPDLVAKLTDFGLALGAADLRLSTSGVPLGSPWYMSPEQVRGIEELDARTDLYALGAVLHEMLTGRKLFDAEGAFAVMRAQVEAVPPVPSSLNPAIPPELDAAVSMALAKDPAMRFRSADEFRLALQRLTTARPVPQPRRPRKSWLAGLPPVALPLRGIGRRARVLMLLVPALLAAGFCVLRFSPRTARGQAAKINPGVAAFSVRNADRPSPMAMPPAAPVAPDVPAPAPVEVPPPPVESIATALPPLKPAVKAVSRPPQSTPATALRITGGTRCRSPRCLRRGETLRIPRKRPRWRSQRRLPSRRRGRRTRPRRRRRQCRPRSPRPPRT